MKDSTHDASSMCYKNEEILNKRKEKKRKKTFLDESLSDCSVSTISNSTGIDSDLYNNVLNEIKKEKKRKQKLKKKKNNSECETTKDRYLNSLNSLSEEQKSRKHKISSSSFDNKIIHKKRKDRKRKNKKKKSKSISKCSYDDPIPKDPFNPLLLAYVKDKKSKYRKKNEDDLNSRWKHDKYESTSNEDSDEKEQNANKALPNIDIFELRKNLWKSKAGGVCLPQIREDIN